MCPNFLRESRKTRTFLLIQKGQTPLTGCPTKGTGTADIIRLSKEAGLQEPEFLQDEDFKTILYRKMTEEITEQRDSKLGNKLGDKLGDTSMKIIVAIKNDKEISIAQLAAQLAISTTAIEKQLAKLKKKGILLRHGTKGGYWEINKESKE